MSDYDAIVVPGLGELEDVWINRAAVMSPATEGGSDGLEQ